MRSALVVLFVVCVVAPVARSDDARPLQVYNTTPEQTAAGAVRTFITLDGRSDAEIEAYRRDLIAAGARNVNWFGDNIIVCDLPRHRDFSPLLSSPGVASRPASAVPDYMPGSSDPVSQVKYAYQLAQRLRTAPRMATGEGFQDRVEVISHQRALEIREQIRNHQGPAALSGPEGAERLVTQNSEILAGSIKFYLILPESNGDIDPSSEDWYLPDGSESPDLVMARSNAFAAILDWQGQFPSMGISFRMLVRVPECRYEPIRHDIDDDELWIRDTMLELDPSLATAGDAQTMVHLWNEANRGGYDWIFTMFIAHSRNVPRHRPNNGNAEYVAYAYLGGPYLVAPYPAGTDINAIGENLVYSQVIEHEAGHIFWALDEYPGAPGNCSDRSGYLNHTNMNITMSGPVTRCVPEVDCIMNRAPWENLGRPFCAWTRGQMGVIDNNGNAIPDVFEAAPVIEFDTPGHDTVITDRLTVHFTARSRAVPNRNAAIAPEDRIDYAAPLREAHFSIGGGWISLVAADGHWDGAVEECSAEIRGLLPGTNPVKFRTRNEVGMYSEEYVRNVYFLGVNLARVRASPRDHDNLIAWEVVGEDFGARYDVYRLAADASDPDLGLLTPDDVPPGALLAADVGPSGPVRNGAIPYAVTDDDVMPGLHYRYYVRASGSARFGGASRDFVTTSDLIRLTAMVPIPAGRVVSHVSPNPFRNDVTLSINVPPTYETTEVTGGASFDQRVPTPLDVTVYDVLGRVIRRLHSSGSFYDVVTLTWDGRTENGRPVASGVYFIRVKTGTAFAVEKVLLIR